MSEEQEPGAWDGRCVLGHCGWPSGCEANGCCRADYTAPPQRPAEPVQEPVAFITPLMEQQMFDDWCPYKGNPDPRTVWAAAVEAMNGLLLGASPPQHLAEPVQEPVAWRTFDGEGGYEYRTYEDNECYAAAWAQLNPNHVGWVEPLYTAPSDDTALLKQALEALYAAERFCGHAKFPAHDVASAITAIRTRLGEKT